LEKGIQGFKESAHFAGKQEPERIREHVSLLYRGKGEGEEVGDFQLN
jgi:hypothetical protein